MRICLPHTDDDRTGYGRMGQQLRAAFRRAGVQVDTDPLRSDAEAVLWAKIPLMVSAWREGQRPCLFTMFETTELPLEFRNLGAFDTVIVPCAANELSFSRWHGNVKRVVLGVDERWGFQPRPFDGPFTFLTAGSGPRKGIDVTLAAFKQAFPEDEGMDVRLVVKTVHPIHDPWLDRLDDDRISVVKGYLSSEDEMDLYGSAHVYVGMARGEGFGLMPLQAMRQGCPIIISEGHGHNEFAYLADETVPTTLTPAIDFTLYGWSGDWWEPDVEACARSMRRLWEDYDAYLHSAQARSEHVAETFTWDATVDALIDALGGPDALKPYSGSGEKVTRAPIEVQFQVNCKVKATIGEHDVSFVPGVTYWHDPNVRDVLAAAGKIATDPLDSQFRFAEVTA